MTEPTPEAVTPRHYLLGVPLGVGLVIVWQLVGVPGVPILEFILRFVVGIFTGGRGPRGEESPYAALGERLNTEGGSAMFGMVVIVVWTVVIPWWAWHSLKVPSPTYRVALLTCATLSSVVMAGTAFLAFT